MELSRLVDWTFGLGLLDLHLLRMALFRWLDILGVVLWVGAIAFRLLVFNPALQSLSDPADRKRIQDEESAYTGPALFGLLVYLFLLHFVTWVHQAEMMSGKPLSAIAPVLPIVLTKTHFGAVWIVKLVLLALALCLARIKNRARDPVLFGIGLPLCLTGTLVGHAVSHSGDYFAVLSDAAHYIAVAIWAGGLFPLRRIGAKAALIADPSARVDFLADLIGAFSKWATAAVIFIVVTGVYNGYSHLNGHSIFEVLYGRVLIGKVLFAAATFGLGGVSRFYILPSLWKMREARSTDASEKIRKRFLLALRVEIAFAFMTLILAALLTQTPPPPPKHPL